MKIDVKITRGVDVIETPRVQQLNGIFDVPPAKRSEQKWHHCFDLPDQWNIGVIVGPSGAGKTTLAKEAFGKELVERWEWPQDKSILDGFPASAGIRDITGLLSSVGFSSPPSWVRPYAALSNGEQFRVNVARTLAEMPDLAVIDEFTSVVDRTVAQIGSAAVAKTVRRRGQKFVAVTCHYDVLDWLEPDWVYEPHTGKLQLNVGLDGSRGLLWLRPRIQIDIVRVDKSAWPIFKPHHYLSGDINPTAQCFVAFMADLPVAFTAVMSFPHPTHPAWREHRTVCLPDFQGVGIGNATSEFVASLYKASGKKYSSVTSSPAMIRHRMKSPLWRCKKAPGFNSRRNAKIKWKSANTAIDRLTASFDFVGPARPIEAEGYGLRVATRLGKGSFAREPETAATG